MTSAMAHLVLVAVVVLCLAFVPPHTFVEANRVTKCWGRSNLISVPDGDFVLLSASAAETCGLNSSHRLQCWGQNTYSQGSVDQTTIYKDVSCGFDHTCAIDALSWQVTCWGINNHNQLQPPPDQFKTVSSGYWHSCGLLLNGTVSCWGDDTYDQAAPTTNDAFLQVASGWWHSCGILNATRQILCWGTNFNNLTNSPTGTFTQLGIGYNHSCALDADGKAHCWGSNTTGQLNAPTTQTFVDLTVGAFFSCGLTAAGDIVCWGDNTNGQQNPPAGFTSWTNITAGHDHMCGIGIAPSPSPSPSVYMSRSPYPSRMPSPSPYTGYVPITVNVSATFGDSPVVDVTAPLPSDSESLLQLRSELSQLQADDSDIANLGWTVANGGGADNTSAAFYSATLPDNSTSVNQSFAFHKDYQAAQFSRFNFTITAGAVKWSINLTNTNASSAPGLSFAYRLTTNATQSTTAKQVTMLRDQPRANMTTYRVPYGYANVVVEVQLFDVALVDGELAYINHSLVLVDNNGNSSGVAYDVVLSFPPFSRSLEYDPSIGLGVLLGSSSDSGGSDNTGLIVGVAVAIPVAVVLVLVVITGALAYGYYRRRQLAGAEGSVIHFAEDRDSDDSL